MSCEKTSKKRLLFITTRLFWPADSGRKVVLYHYCKGLANRLGYEVHLFSFLEGDQTPVLAVNKPSFIASVSLASPVGAAEKVANLCSAVFNPLMPFQCCLFMSRANRHALADLIKDLKPNVVMVDMVRLAPYLDGLSTYQCAKVINFDDLLSKRYRRQIGKTGGAILGKYGSQAGGFMKSIVTGPLKDRVLTVEANRCERAETHYASLSDASLLISSVETSELSSRIGGKSCFCATMGAEVTSVSSGKPYLYDLGFVGNLHTAANQDSLRLLVREILPLLPGRTLQVIGVCPDEVMRAYEDVDSVNFTGRVDNVSEHLGRCKVLLAPFVYGTGIKTKVLEAMGMGVPVVTNSIGLEGISAKVGKDVLCAEDSNGLAHEALRLLDDDKLRMSVAANGRNYVMSTHTWDKSINELGKCLEYTEASSEGCVVR